MIVRPGVISVRLNVRIVRPGVISVHLNVRIVRPGEISVHRSETTDRREGMRGLRDSGIGLRAAMDPAIAAALNREVPDEAPAAEEEVRSPVVVGRPSAGPEPNQRWHRGQ
jgi:hypothetical protein